MSGYANTTPTTLNIVVGVLTYKRPEGILKLLESLQRQQNVAARPFNLTVVVIDNDVDESGRNAVCSFENVKEFTLRYVVEPRQGIPIARNRALDEAPIEADLFCFLDDDEWAIDTWVDDMLAVRAQTGADCIYGPVEPVYPLNPPRFFIAAKIFERKRNRDCERLNYAASNNVMFDYRLVRSWNLRFEERMRFTGGTDYLFFNQANRLGMKIHWSSSAIVYDIIPRNRMTWKWVLRRQYRLGNTFAVSEILHGTRKRQIYRVCYGVARIGLGVAMTPLIVVSPYWGMRGLSHLLRGVGMVNGILGHSYQEYQPSSNQI